MQIPAEKALLKFHFPPKKSYFKLSFKSKKRLFMILKSSILATIKKKKEVFVG